MTHKHSGVSIDEAKALRETYYFPMARSLVEHLSQAKPDESSSLVSSSLAKMLERVYQHNEIYRESLFSKETPQGRSKSFQLKFVTLENIIDLPHFAQNFFPALVRNNPFIITFCHGFKTVVDKDEGKKKDHWIRPYNHAIKFSYPSSGEDCLVWVPTSGEFSSNLTNFAGRLNISVDGSHGPCNSCLEDLYTSFNHPVPYKKH